MFPNSMAKDSAKIFIISTIALYIIQIILRLILKGLNYLLTDWLFWVCLIIAVFQIIFMLTKRKNVFFTATILINLLVVIFQTVTLIQTVETKDIIDVMLLISQSLFIIPNIVLIVNSIEPRSKTIFIPAVFYIVAYILYIVFFTIEAARDNRFVIMSPNYIYFLIALFVVPVQMMSFSKYFLYNEYRN